MWKQSTAILDEEAIHGAVHAADEVEPEAGVQWPEPPDEAALHGVAGDLVRLVRDQTESDPVAILTQFLVAAGNAFGRTLYRHVEATHHHLNLFLALVGPSSKGRKGTAWDWCERVVAAADPYWKCRIQTGLSSGEGVIHCVRDKVDKPEESRKGKKSNESRIVDAGVSDKRALFVQPEFSAVLKVCGREGNILSDVLRAAWDGKSLQVASKNSAETSTDPHISLVSHISREELIATLSSTDAANGFGNRLLWVCAKRANLLPFGGNLAEGAIDSITTRLGEALAWARKSPGEFTFDPEAESEWVCIYPGLSADRTGLAGALLSRSEAQVLRLTMVYAALDSAHVIRMEHVRAALAVWNYCERSVAFIFRDKTGNPLADTILAQLLKKGAEGLSRTEIHGLVSRHVPAADVDQALGALRALGLAVMTLTKTPGRPEQRWCANKGRDGRKG